MKKIMFKKVELWVVALLCVLFLIALICYGGILRYEFLGVPKFPILKKTALFLAEIPHNLKPSNLKRSIALTLEPTKDLETSHIHIVKPRFKKFIHNKREEILLLSRYDGNLNRSVVEVIDLNDFSVLHTFKPDIDKINSKTDINRKEFEHLLKDKNLTRYQIKHPLILKNGDLVFKSEGSPLVKVDFCSKLLWVNDEDTFHHSSSLDHEDNYWVPSRIFPFSVDKELVGDGINNFLDDAITKISKDGKILYQKSVAEILIENGYKALLFGNNKSFFWDPIHLNDIEPTLNDSPFWKKDDLFLSIRSRSLILHYRPQTNQLINVIHGPFSLQHDVDIISDREISIFNNNAFYKYNGMGILKNNNSEVVIYNFETKQFYQKFTKSMKENSVKTVTQGLSDILEDGSMMVEEQEHGRILFFDNIGNLEWEYVNKADNNKIYAINWSRVIKSKPLIESLKQKIQNTKCIY
tara:strand:- start:420 stop:1820 length:1401 start_codon:yes stop_codon:yes gene_type:complete